MHPNPWNSRMDLPYVLRRFGLDRPDARGVEVGVQRGEFASYLLSNWSGRLSLVDPWQRLISYKDAANYDDTIQEAFMNETVMRCQSIAPGRFVVIRELSLLAASLFDDRGMDFVYLDADHSYSSVQADISAWWPKVKTGGILAGHDYITDGFYFPGSLKPHKEYQDGMSEFGVIRAVTEFTERENLNLWITSPANDGGWASWLVVKP